jgi:[ribosomal protein S5]-alanine N-acetyltransferase
MQIEVAPNLWISPFGAEDAGALVELLSDREIHRMTLRIPYPYTASDADRWLKAVAEQPRLQDSCAIRQASGRLIGGIGLHRGELWTSHRAELGYWLGRPYRGQGIMTQVVRAAVQYAFERLDLTKLTAQVYADNPASVRVLQKCGFAEEGLLRSDILKEGELIDMRLFGLVH